MDCMVALRIGKALQKQSDYVRTIDYFLQFRLRVDFAILTNIYTIIIYTYKKLSCVCRLSVR